MAQADWRALLNFRCTGCGNCCRRTIVMITDGDVARIAEGTGRPAAGFVRFVPEAVADLPLRSPWWVRFDGARAVMALRHRPGGACTFLDDGNRCTIYAHRPVTCREHPFEITLSETLAVEHVAISAIVECPHAWDGHNTRRELREVVRWNERQSDPYLERVRTWNRRRGRRTRPEFLRYLGLAG